MFQTKNHLTRVNKNYETHEPFLSTIPFVARVHGLGERTIRWKENCPMPKLIIIKKKRKKRTYFATRAGHCCAVRIRGIKRAEF